MNLCDKDQIRELLGRHGFHFSKSMGQNFLIDPAIPAAIAEASQAGPETGVLEIGPGAGSLTAELAQRAGRVASVELDRSLLPVLAETMAPYPNVEIVSGDVLRMDLTALAEEKFLASGLTPIVCANLPYNITTPVLTKLVETPAFQSVTVLLQKEVAQRLAAPPAAGPSPCTCNIIWRQASSSPCFGKNFSRPPRWIPPSCGASAGAVPPWKWRTRPFSSGCCGGPFFCGGKPWPTVWPPPFRSWKRAGFKGLSPNAACRRTSGASG